MRKIILNWLFEKGSNGVLRNLEISYKDLSRDLVRIRERLDEHDFLINSKPRFEIGEECIVKGYDSFTVVDVVGIILLKNCKGYYRQYRLSNGSSTTSEGLIKMSEAKDLCSLKRKK